MSSERHQESVSPLVGSAEDSVLHMSSDVNVLASQWHRSELAKRLASSDAIPLVFVRLGHPEDESLSRTLKALLDSGSSATLIAEPIARKLELKMFSGNNVVWTTPAGKLHTTNKCKARFSFPELHDDRKILWDFHVSENLGAYDIILGRDLLRDLGIKLNFEADLVDWDGHDMPMKDRDDGMQVILRKHETWQVPWIM